MPSSNTQRQLENHLTLHTWLNSQFGYKTTQDLLNDVKSLGEEFNPDGHSPINEFLLSREGTKTAIAAALSTYDANIKRHLATINNKRSEPIVLRYFQYLALLYAEIFLDWKFNRPSEFLRRLNDLVQRHNDARAPGDAMDTRFTNDDLEKLAFWMATGAGKTLIMHINYHQYLHYCEQALDNIILITPNEGLSEQHLRELGNSNVPCERFNIEGNRLTHAQNAIQVIEITKLVEVKTGGGLSVPVEAFDGNNLIFVDEGHKGSGGNAWRDYREKIAETGFTFEYSATFGQALAAANNADLVDEYGKAIAFDYSYRYFYSDGYGKNFRILNVKHDEASQTETLLMGNLLSFYEQRRYFRQNPEPVHTYGLDPPLWTFVGSKVSGNVVYKEGGKTRSDVLNVLRFLNRFLKNEGSWATDNIEKILKGESGLSNNGADIFHNRLNFLRNLSETPAQIYTGILNEVFHTNTIGALHLQDVRNAPGEIALKTTHGWENFGLIYIGDTAAFKKLVNSDDAGIKTDSEDVLTESLFNDINKSDSYINILIGAKKFMEGWDSWRVTAMGLLNIGTQEGSQIIQLFGRGIRLRGKDMSLKRSAALDGEHPRNLPLLETLNIFAVRANFMERFQAYLGREGVPVEDPVQLELPIKPNMEYLAKRLYVPMVVPYGEAAKGKCVILDVDPPVIITHTTQSVEIIDSRSQGIFQGGRAEAALQTQIEKPSLSLVDWERIYLQLLEYKQQKGYHNLVFDTEILKEILNPSRGLYELHVMDESEVNPKTQEQLKRLEALVLTLLRKYISKFYGITQKRWNEERVRLKLLDKSHANFTDWSVSISQEDASELEPQINSLMENGEIYGPDPPNLPIIFNERHLYQPLLTASEADTSLRATPPALVESEKDFVKDLRSFVREQREALLAKKEVFLLRNQSRGRGIGFYENEGFYPDFILWILEGVQQRIVFVEPHGMVHEVIDEYNPKITVFKRLRTLSQKYFRGERVVMDSFIISKTPFAKLRHRGNRDKRELEIKWHILFQDSVNINYLSPIFGDVSPEQE